MGESSALVVRLHPVNVSDFADHENGIVAADDFIGGRIKMELARVLFDADNQQVESFPDFRFGQGLADQVAFVGDIQFIQLHFQVGGLRE